MKQSIIPSENFIQITEYGETVMNKVKELELQVNSYVGRDDEYEELKLKLEFAKGELNAYETIKEYIWLDIR